MNQKNKRGGEKKTFDALADTYDEELQMLLNVKNTEKFAEYKIQLIKYLISNTSPLKNILDFGCGTGRSLCYLKDYFFNNEYQPRVFGCDVSPESLRIAQSMLPEGVFFLDDTIESLYKQNCRFDLVLVACVLHHIEPSQRVEWVHAITDNLNDGGYIAVFEHNLKNPFTKRIVYSPNNPVDNPDYMLTQKELVRLLLDSDPRLRVYWKGYTLFSPIRKECITKLETNLRFLPLGAQHCVIVKADKKNEK